MLGTCRVCLVGRAKINIFHMQDSAMISAKIMSIAKVQIHPEDGLPNSICKDCLQELDICFKFKLKCETSDQKLRKLTDTQSDSDDTNHESDDKRLLITSENSIESSNLIKLQISDSSALLCELEDDDSERYTNDQLNLKKELKSICDKQEDKYNKQEVNRRDVDKQLETKKTKYSKGHPSKKKSSHGQQCFTCGKLMSSRYRLITHLQTHTGERPFACKHCNKKFSSAQNLKVHTRTHTGEKPFQCNTCEATFAHGAGLATHMRKHTGESPYSCTLCPRSFRTYGHMQYHIRRHTGEKQFECDVCSKAFITRSDLKQHSVTHSGVRAHVCSICGLKLARASHLRRHMTTHNKPYSCNQCGSKFIHKAMYEKHNKKHSDALVEDEK